LGYHLMFSKKKGRGSSYEKQDVEISAQRPDSNISFRKKKFVFEKDVSLLFSSETHHEKGHGRRTNCQSH